MIKIFIHEKPLIICQGNDMQPNDYVKLESVTLWEHILKTINSSNVKGLYYITVDEKKTLQDFAKNFTMLEAAGGVVLNHENKYLLIERLEKWDLPKGKIEAVESPQHAALREVCEETGVCDLEIIKPIRETYHTYVHKEKNILKKTYWYLMRCNSFSGFKPQYEEQITDARWMTNTEVKEAMKKTYTSIADLAEDVLNS